MSHLGIQVADAGTLRRELTRVRGEGLEVRVETSVDCCHANQDRFWVVDPDGVEWELYHLNYDLPEGEPPHVREADDCCAIGDLEAVCCGGAKART